MPRLTTPTRFAATIVLSCLLILLAFSSAVAQTPESSAASQPAVYPAVIAQLDLAIGVAEIQDFRRDPMTGALYVTDSDGRLHIVNGETLAVTVTLPVGGDLELDAVNRRLYLMPGDAYLSEGETPTIHVVDLSAQTVVGEIENARYLSLDPTQNRIFTGQPLSSYTPANVAPVRVYDMETLEQIDEFDLVGIPLYLRGRRELVVVSYTALVIDPDTHEVLTDLLPEVSDVPFRWCNGCAYAERAYRFPDDNVLAIDLTRVGTGPGAGIYPQPAFFDARTLEPLQGEQPVWQATCSSLPHLQWPMDGLQYSNHFYARYVFYWNFRVEDQDGALVALRDGLYANFINPTTRQAIVDSGYVVDLATLEPVGTISPFCWLDYDPEGGTIYGKQAGTLVILAEEGGTPPTFPDGQIAPLPQARISRILPSPDFVHDQTVFVIAGGREVYRSRDGGLTWMRLAGGLPNDTDLTLDLAISPNFATDQTLYAGGHVRTYRGQGVLRSQDSGDTWSPLWRDMEYLRVTRVAVSPEFATDHIVAAYSDFDRIDPWIGGSALYTSTDEGLSWTLVMTSSQGSVLPTPAELWETASLPVRIADGGRGLERRADDGTWQTVKLSLPEGESVQTVVASPDFTQDQTLYVQGSSSILRTGDGGRTWQQWIDPWLEGRTYENELSALAVVPLADGGHELWVGTAAGELWQLRPRVAEDDAQPTLLPNPTALPTPAASATPTPAAAISSQVTSPVSSTVESSVASLSGDPPAGLYQPLGAFASLWEADPALQQALGWAKAEEATPIQAARQEFQRGDMIWRGDSATIYVLGRDAAWQVFPDTYADGEPESDPSLIPPSGLLQPIRGFGKLWRGDATLQERLGWAKAKEQGYGGYVQEFEHGVIISGGDRTRILIGEDAGEIWW